MADTPKIKLKPSSPGEKIMFKVKNTIYSMPTQAALKKITGSTGFKDMNLSFSLTALRIEYERGKKTVDEEQKKILLKYCDKKKDNKDEPDLTSKGEYKFTMQNGVKVQDEIKKLYEITETVLNVDKLTIKLDQIPAGLLSADDMYYLKDLINIER